MIVAGQRNRMNEVVGNLHVDILRVGMHGAVPLVLGQALRLGEASLNVPQNVPA